MYARYQNIHRTHHHAFRPEATRKGAGHKQRDRGKVARSHELMQESYLYSMQCFSATLTAAMNNGVKYFRIKRNVRHVVRLKGFFGSTYE